MSNSTFHFGPKKSWPFPGTTPGGEHLFGASPKTLNNITNINNTANNPKWFGTMPQMKYTLALDFYAYYGAYGWTTLTLYSNNTIYLTGNRVPTITRMDDSFNTTIGTWTPGYGTYNLNSITELNPTGYTSLKFGANTTLEYFMLYQNGVENLGVYDAWTEGLFISPNPNGWRSVIVANQINSNTVICDSVTIHMQSYIKQAGASCRVRLKYSIYDFK